MLETIQKIGVFMILAEMLLPFVSDESFEKIIRILTRIILFLMLCLPLVNLLRSGSEKEFQGLFQGWQTKLESDLGREDCEETRAKWLRLQLSLIIRDRVLRLSGYETKQMSVEIMENHVVLRLPYEDEEEETVREELSQILGIDADYLEVWVGQGKAVGADYGENSEAEIR